MLCIEVFKDDYKVTSNFLAGSINVNPVIVRNVLYYYDGDNSDVVIPSGVVRICDSAFCDTRVMITSVVIPDSVTEIGDGAFADCRMLKKVHMSANIRKIEDTSFVNCISLTDIEIPDTIESIVDGAFTCF